jgi:hypothetical protein
MYTNERFCSSFHPFSRKMAPLLARVEKGVLFCRLGKARAFGIATVLTIFLMFNVFSLISFEGAFGTHLFE